TTVAVSPAEWAHEGGSAGGAVRRECRHDLRDAAEQKQPSDEDGGHERRIDDVHQRDDPKDQHRYPEPHEPLPSPAQRRIAGHLHHRLHVVHLLTMDRCSVPLRLHGPTASNGAGTHRRHAGGTPPGCPARAGYVAAATASSASAGGAAATAGGAG